MNYRTFSQNPRTRGKKPAPQTCPLPTVLTSESRVIPVMRSDQLLRKTSGPITSLYWFTVATDRIVRQSQKVDESL